MKSAISLKMDGAGDGTRTRDVQLGKTTVNWKQRLLRFRHLVLAIQVPLFSPCGSAWLLNGAQTEHTKEHFGEMVSPYPFSENLSSAGCSRILGAGGGYVRAPRPARHSTRSPWRSPHLPAAPALALSRLPPSA